MSDGVWAKVSGTVGRIFDTKNGPGMVVEVTRPNSQYPDRVTVWDAFTFQVGEPAIVEGWLSWRKSERDGRTYVDVNLNQPRVSGGRPELSPVVSTTAPTGYDPCEFGATDSYGEVPF